MRRTFIFWELEVKRSLAEEAGSTRRRSPGLGVAPAGQDPEDFLGAPRSGLPAGLNRQRFPCQQTCEGRREGLGQPPAAAPPRAPLRIVRENNAGRSR